MESRDSALFSSTDPLTRAETEAGFRRELRIWRAAPLRGFAISMLVACVIAAAWFHITPYGLTSQTLELWSGALALVALLVVGKRLPLALRSAALLAIVFLVCLGSILQIGVTPNAMVGFSTLAVAATILFGVRIAIASIVMMMLAILAVCSLHAAGWVEQAPNWMEILDGTRLVNGVRIASLFGLLSITSAVGISFLLRRTEDLAWQQVQAVRALRSEQAETARLQRDLELREAALHKARELETLGRLAGSMAHDFNNALLVIWGAIDELSQEDLSDSQAAEALEALRIASEQATATTRSLRAFGRGTPRCTSTLEVGALISRATATLSRVLPPNIRLESEVHTEASIAADEGELLRVLTNLALNARDAMREGGMLTLRARPAEAREQLNGASLVAIEVSDTGTGIPKDVQERLFEPYFTTKQAGGTGLGLASVREIVRAHQGEVRVSSEPGRGTTITLLWPISASVEASERASGATATVPGAGRAVLVVDDEAAVRSTVARGLGRAGFQVVEAADAATALEALRRSKLQLDVLCTDWMMPGTPARQLIEEFRRVHGGAVLVCSGYAPEETSITPEMVDDFLPKPFSGDELVQRIQHLLSERSQTNAIVV
jgi:signal transduction histidine kinase/ActR/RegA family two-component response regulator